jgi:hypothetical protein
VNAKAYARSSSSVQLDPVEEPTASGTFTLPPGYRELYGGVQLQPADGAYERPADQVQALASSGLLGAGTELPHLAAIQKSFGHHDVTHVQAHLDGAAAQASQAMGVHAFANGNHVAFASDAPSLHTAAHEAAHTIQQRGGVQLAGGVGRANDPYERHADAVADRVVRGESSEALLDTLAGGGATPAVQREQVDIAQTAQVIAQDGMDAKVWINGHITESETAAFPAPGNVRYFVTNGVGDCVAFGIFGTRKSDNAPMAFVGHLSSAWYGGGPYGGDWITKVTSKMNVSQQIVVTNFSWKGSRYHLMEKLHPDLKKGGVYNTGDDDEPGYASYMIDCTHHDIKIVTERPRARDETGTYQVGASVSSFFNEKAQYDRILAERKEAIAQRMAAHNADGADGAGRGGAGKGGGKGNHPGHDDKKGCCILL